MQDQDPWIDCPRGTVSEMAAQLRRRKSRMQRRPAVAFGLALLLFSAVGYGLMDRDEPGTRAGLTCQETVPLLAKYHDRSLEATAANDVQEHLSHCPMCRKRYEARYPNEVRNHSSAENRLVAVAAYLPR